MTAGVTSPNNKAGFVRIPLPTLSPAPVRLISVLSLTQILAWGSTFYLPAVLAASIARESGWSLGSVVARLSWGLLVAGFSAPRAGRLIDRFGGRPVLATSSLLLAAGLALMGLAPSLLVYFLAWTVLGTAMASGLYDAAFSTLGRLFGDNSRTAMTGVTLMGGFASTVAWPAITGLGAELGWRDTCLVLAGVHLAVPESSASCHAGRQHLGRSKTGEKPLLPWAGRDWRRPRKLMAIRIHGRRRCQRQATLDGWRVIHR